MEEERQMYASYNILARKALIAGLPIITLVLFLCIILVTGLLGVIFFGPAKGAIVPSILLAILFGIKMKCMEDSRAMEAVWWDLKGMASQIQCRSSVTSFTSTNDSIQRRYEHVLEHFKNAPNLS